MSLSKHEHHVKRLFSELTQTESSRLSQSLWLLISWQISISFNNNLLKCCFLHGWNALYIQSSNTSGEKLPSIRFHLSPVSPACVHQFLLLFVQPCWFLLWRMNYWDVLWYSREYKLAWKFFFCFFFYSSL